MKCSNCGFELPEGARFCPSCGASVSDDAEQSSGSVGSSETGTTSGPPATSYPRESDRERDRRRDFETAWSGSSSASTPPPPPSAAPTGDAGSEQDDEFDDTASIGSLGGRGSAGWERDRSQARSAGDESWQMSNLGPARPQRRRRWLWILLGIIAFIMIACCVFSWWLTTDSGTAWFNDLATRAANEIQRATEQAGTPVP